MRMLRSFFALIIALTVFVNVAAAEQEAPESIRFRNIPWFDTEESVKPSVESINGIKSSWYNPVDESARIESWYRPWKYIYSEINVYDAGVILSYENAPVAGYYADLELSFAYAIVDGKVQYNTDTAQFYMAKYSIEDLEDVEGAYNGLVEKLTQLYGTPKNKSHDDTKGMLWIAEDNSLVWVSMFYNSIDNKYEEINITYAAPDTDRYLLNLEQQIQAETSASEAVEREQNSENYDGL